MEIESLRGDLLTEKISGLNMPKTGKTIIAALNVIAEVTDSNPPTGLISIPIEHASESIPHASTKNPREEARDLGKKKTHRIGTVA